jgi:hypothetical protein
MITIKMYDGENYEFNLPGDKEQKFLDLYEAYKSKTINMNTAEGSVPIKLYDITECYIGRKEEKKYDSNIFNESDVVDFLGGIFNFKK